MLDSVIEPIQYVVDSVQNVFLSQSKPVQSVICFVFTLIPLLTCFLFTKLLQLVLLKVKSDMFPKTAWTQHCMDLQAYNTFLNEYEPALQSLSLQNKDAIKRVHKILLKHNADFVDYPNGTFASRISGLPVFPRIDRFSMQKLPKGFRYVTDTKRFKSFKSMYRWHVFCNLICTVPIIVLCTVSFVAIAQFYIFVLSNNI